MTREEAIEILKAMSDISTQGDAIDMAIEALSSSDALLKQEIDFHKEVSRIEAEKVVDLEHKLADMVSVVRCKNCRHRDLFSCPLADNDFQKGNTNQYLIILIFSKSKIRKNKY